jgi:single-strand DNA-binding protein
LIPLNQSVYLFYIFSFNADSCSAAIFISVKLNTKMSSVRNSVQLVGNLGKDVEIKEFDSGSVMVSFTLATNEYYKNSKGEKVQETQWHKVVAWGKLGELMHKYLAKGSEVLVKGRLVSRTYNDKEGNTRYVTEVIANDFIVFSRKQELAA